MASDERAELVGAAWKVLERSGFEGFKVQLVMREAGVSARRFYQLYPDKETLLLALLQDEMARAGAHLRSALAQSEGPLEQVENWIRGVIGAAADPRRVARARLFTFQQAVMRRFSVELDESIELLVGPLRDALALGRSTGSFPWADPDGDAVLIYALAGGAMTDALVERPDRAVEDVMEQTIGFVVRALGVPPT
jgi:AcrR family transcriptional regulator